MSSWFNSACSGDIYSSTRVRVLVAEYQLVGKTFIWILRCRIAKHLLQKVFLKSVYTQNLQNAVQAFFGVQLLFHNSYQHIDTDGNPDLGLDRVVAGAVKVFDA